MEELKKSLCLKKHNFLLRLASIITLSILSTSVFALRPFESTDADVIDAKETEIEFGLITVERDEDETSYISPSLVFNYGLTNSLELVAEFEIERTTENKWEIVDPGLFLKSILRDGILQGNQGLSIATEFGFLLPSTQKNEKDIGGEALMIASGGIAELAYHINVGGGINLDGHSFSVWGVIGEIPLSESLTLVGEVSGEDTTRDNSEQSILLGIVVNPASSNIEWDLGVRRGITNAATDYSLTFGFTFTY